MDYFEKPKEEAIRQPLEVFKQNFRHVDNIWVRLGGTKPDKGIF